MGSFDHPVLRGILIIFAAGGLTQLYIGIAGYVNWPPFGYYPSFGSTAYIAVYIVSLIIVGAILWVMFRGHVNKRDLKVQGVLQY
jgi:hypothetical protein